MSGAAGTGARSVGPVTACRVDIPEGSVRIEGTDEPTAWLDVRYADPAANAGADPLRDGAVMVEHHGGALLIRRAEGSRSGLLGLLGVARRPRIAVDVRLPRDARVEVSTVGGDVRVVGCRGGQVVSTVTGRATIVGAEGDVEVRSIVGPLDIGGGSLDIQAATTSGRLRVVGSDIRNLRVRSVSSRIEVAGHLAAGNEHRLESVSGDIELTVVGGATIAHRTLSGRLTGDPHVRRDVRDGRSTMVVGDGSASVHVQTVSGDIRLASGVADGAIPRGGIPHPSPRPEEPDPVLAALEALARGDISVDEAGRRLEAIHG